jgi:DNA-binding protein Fis
MAESKEEILFKTVIEALLAFCLLELVVNHRGTVYGKIIDVMDSVIIPLALKHFNGNQVKTAVSLGISRNTLRTRMKKLGLL